MSNKNNVNKQKKGLKRNTIDKFYTKKDVAKLCIDLIKKEIKINKNDLIIEPSAGNGVFMNFIKTLSKNIKFYDIEPDNDSIIKKDFLKLEINFNKIIHFIGNPPFGRQSSMAIKFIKKCCKYGKSISFILPKSFKKDSMIKHFTIDFHLVKQIDLDKNSFLLNNEEYNVPCVFQIWVKKDFNREVPKKLEPVNFKFVKKDENPDISFRRVGVNASNISKNIEDKSIQSHYFIKLNEVNDEIIKKLSNIKFNSDNTVGPKSISKPELIKKFNLVLS